MVMFCKGRKSPVKANGKLIIIDRGFVKLIIKKQELPVIH